MERKCPLCGKAFVELSAEPYHPFCSTRCKRADLQNWLNGSYRLPRELIPEDIDSLSEEEQAELLMRMSAKKGTLA